ncbi:MAG: response regulator [Clostridia bacterium]
METIRVLIADDEELICKSLASKVGRVHHPRTYEVSYVTSAVDALVAHARLHPDVLITDLNMPGMNGFALVTRLRQIDSRLHILVVSGYDDFAYVRKAFVLGVNDYLLKPVAMSELDEKLLAVQPLPQAEIAPVSKETNPSQMIAAVLAYVQANENTRQSLKEIAERLGVNYAHLSTRFNAQMGCSFPAYLLQRRMERAQIYLQDASLHITDVARKVGYADANTFSRDYKRYFGASPMKHRETGDSKENP